MSHIILKNYFRGGFHFFTSVELYLTLQKQSVPPRCLFITFNRGRLLYALTVSIISRCLRPTHSATVPTYTLVAAHPLIALQFTVCPQTQKHPEYTGPALGPKMADANKREFTEDQLRASEGHLNLQMGFNKGASQSGLGSFGNSRHM